MRDARKAVNAAGALAGRRALVTGGTSGIGAAIAARLAVDGAEIVVTGTQPGREPPAGFSYHAVDFADDSATAAFAEVVASLDLDILVNNAGINKIAPFEKIDPDDFDRIQRVNVRAPFLLCRAALPAMRKRGWGRIVNVSSIWGVISKEYRGSYSASKFALDGLTAALSAEVAADGVLANCVSPGIIDTELTHAVLGEQGVAELAARVPAGRLGTPDEIAALVAWLVSPENTYLTGQNVVIDGGFSRI
jgi:NAD(P)-dependent dehydrogenase (short-subunit alcohol dehydrogenase family)